MRGDIAGFRVALVVAVFLASSTLAATAQGPPLTGRWVALERDQGIVVTLTIGTTSTLVIPGTGPNGRTEALTLQVRSLQQGTRSMTFTVDLPEDNGAVDLEFRLESADDLGVLSILKVEGEPVDDDFPRWKLRKQRDLAL